MLPTLDIPIQSTVPYGAAHPSKEGPDLNLLRYMDDLRFGKTRTQMRIKGALWQKLHKTAQPSRDTEVIFAIPLVSRGRAPDWTIVCAALSDTLASFQRQTNARWRAVICGQDRPDCPELGDPRIEFIRSSARDKFYDKGDKRRQLIEHIARNMRIDGYYMQFDADDILHPGFVEHLLADNNGQGYVVTQGYFMNVAANQIAPLDTFNRHCGSCAAVYVDFRRGRRYAQLLKQHRSHTKIAEICSDYGITLAPVPMRSVIYMAGHGQNMIERRGKLDERSARFLRHPVTDPAEADAILREFGLREVQTNNNEQTTWQMIS